jgi:hypothetical protein
MRISERSFHCLSLCARPPGDAFEARERFRTAFEALPSWNDLLDSAEHHGLEGLLAAHIREASVPIPLAASDRLRARCVQHAHAFAVRTRVVSEFLSALDQAGVRLLVLKGAALAHLVYSNPLLRPMRDVDVLVPEHDARRAWDVLRRFGFSASGRPLGPSHHHLQGLSKTVDGATVTIELHTELLARTPFVEPLRYQDLCPASQTFDWGGLTLHTLGREDMLWHVYAHAFVINVFCRGIRLISVADLIHATEAWLDALDWDDMDRRYRRLVRALPHVHQLTPWSSHVWERMRYGRAGTAGAVRPIVAPFEWWGALHHDVLWPPEWWFGMRYGVQGPLDWMWYRFIGHPVRLAAAAAAAVTRRMSTRSSHPALAGSTVSGRGARSSRSCRSPVRVESIPARRTARM